MTRTRWFSTVMGWAVLAAVSMAATVGLSAEEVPRSEHPRPGFRRQAWLCLNGEWQFRFDPEDRGVDQRWFATAEGFDRRIMVPFCWQSKLSGIEDTTGQQIGWYFRTVKVPGDFQGKHVWLRFEAVDWEARVWVNGQEVGRHEGGYTPAQFDVTELVAPGKEATIAVRAFDATDRELPLGKQVPGWYTPVSGIWQTVWLEARPATHVARLRLTPVCLDRKWSVVVELDVVGADGKVEIQLESPDATVEQHKAELTLAAGRGRHRAVLPVRDPKLWTPEGPHLYDLTIRLVGPDSTEDPDSIDVVQTYFGLRTIGRGRHGELPHESILLNGEPVYLRGALDQSFNPDGIYTAPSDEFMRRDMELAKEAGFNFLRIHIKSEEPRRLYWADRTGVLIMEDMPCPFRQSPRARLAWQQTMRATIARDVNHPSIIAWCLFNETWGLGGNDYKQDRDTQAWVLRTFAEVKQRLDPSRLVEDNSPCRYDHVKTDLNSWHFYIDDYRRARDHIEQIVENTRPGSPLNYVPGRVQDTAPLLNSEYGAISARGGDRDVSWGFRHLTTQLRRHELIQGYVYTELTDVEWEHNGVLNYDRSAKEFGYDAFVAAMTIADLQGADFVGYDAPPAIESAPGERFTLPVFVSHFSRRKVTPTLAWRIVGTDDLGRTVSTPRQQRPTVWDRCRVTFQEPLEVRVPKGRPFVGALTLELLDDDDCRIGANFVNLIVRQDVGDATDGRRGPSREAARVEVLSPRLVAVRFSPDDFTAFRSDEPDWKWLDNRGKFYTGGKCEVEYHVALPKFVREAIPSRIVLMAEMATKADDQRLDWPARRQSLDYPQTQTRKYAGKVAIRLLGRDTWELALPDDPADARGVLSHQARYQHGSYGYLVRQKVDLTENEALRAEVREKEFFPLSIRTLDEHGLSIYGRRLGRYPIDPTLIIETAKPMPRAMGWTSSQPVAIHRLLEQSRIVEGVKTGESDGHAWRYTTEKPPEDWAGHEFDDSSWPTGKGGFGSGPAPAIAVGTPWKSPDIWLRTEFEFPARPVGVVLRYFHDEDAEIYVNGKLLHKATGYVRNYQQRPVSKARLALFREGSNTLAVHCRQTRGGQGVDVGVRWIEVEQEEVSAPGDSEE
ncbi:MAG: hypothetical protein HQ567_25035 [Candidatus Nealsonbacteria bacterium]|nr:hypothetical protein [Candidatus Nealsonbacteria bacterium]